MAAAPGGGFLGVAAGGTVEVGDGVTEHIQAKLPPTYAPSFGTGYYPFSPAYTPATVLALNIPRSVLVPHGLAPCHMQQDAVSKTHIQLALVLLEFVSSLGRQYKSEQPDFDWCIEPLMAEDKANQDPVGWRIWLYIMQGNTWQAGERLFQLIRVHDSGRQPRDSHDEEDPTDAGAGKRPRGRSSGKRDKLPHHDIRSVEQFARCATIKNAFMLLNYNQAAHICLSQKLTDETNPLNPIHVFAPEKTMGGVPGLAGDQQNIRNYWRPDSNDPAVRVWTSGPEAFFRYTPDQLRIATFMQLNLPVPQSVCDTKRFYTSAFSSFRQLVEAKSHHECLPLAIEQALLPPGAAGLSGGGGGGGGGVDEKLLQELYDSAVPVTDSGGGALTAQKLEAQNAERARELQTHVHTLRTKKRFDAAAAAYEMRRRITQRRIDRLEEYTDEQLRAEYQALWSEEDEVVVLEEAEIQAIISRWERHLTAKKSLEALQLCQDYAYTSPFLRAGIKYMHAEFAKCGIYRPFRKLTSNLSLWNDFQLFFMQSAQMIMKTVSAHHTMWMVWLSLLNASDPSRKFHLNILLWGPSQTAKSFGFDMVSSLLAIPGTTSELTTSTLNANNVGGDGDEHVEIYHEAPGKMFGAGPMGPQRTEAEERLKQRLTSGHNTITTIVIDPSGMRRKQNIKQLMSGSLWAATNEHAHNMSAEALTRFLLAHVMSTSREGRDITDALASSDNENMDRVVQRYSEFMRFLHGMVMLVNLMIKTGVLPPVNTSLSKALLGKILSRARRYGVPNTRQPRHFARMMCAVRAAVIVNAILVVYCSRLSPYMPLDADASAENGGGASQRFELRNLAEDVRPWLSDTDPSIAISVLGDMREQYGNDADHATVRAILDRYMGDATNRAALLKCKTHESLKTAVERAQAGAESLSELKSHLCAAAAGAAENGAPPHEEEEEEEGRFRQLFGSALRLNDPPGGLWSSSEKKAVPPRAVPQEEEKGDEKEEVAKERLRQQLLSCLRQSYVYTDPATNVTGQYYHIKKVFSDANAPPFAKRAILASVLARSSGGLREEDVKQSLRQLEHCEVEMTDPSTGNSFYIPTIQYLGCDVLLSIRACELNGEDMLKRAVRDVMEHEHAIPGRYLFGKRPVGVSEQSWEPDRLNYIDIRRLPKHRLQLINYNTYSDGQVDLLQSALGEGVPVREAFGDAKAVDCDMPLEHMLWQRYLRQNGYTVTEIRERGLLPESELRAQLLKENKLEQELWHKEVYQLTARAVHEAKATRKPMAKLEHIVANGKRLAVAELIEYPAGLDRANPPLVERLQLSPEMREELKVHGALGREAEDAAAENTATSIPLSRSEPMLPGLETLKFSTARFAPRRD